MPDINLVIATAGTKFEVTDEQIKSLEAPFLITGKRGDEDVEAAITFFQELATKNDVECNIEEREGEVPTLTKSTLVLCCVDRRVYHQLWHLDADIITDLGGIISLESTTTHDLIEEFAARALKKGNKEKPFVLTLTTHDDCAKATYDGTQRDPKMSLAEINDEATRLKPSLLLDSEKFPNVTKAINEEVLVPRVGHITKDKDGKFTMDESLIAPNTAFRVSLLEKAVPSLGREE
tara:strand:+ start:3257 stop:3961 length:705 start_codon:yes stop_codon:yes gene_type:complete